MAESNEDIIASRLEDAEAKISLALTVATDSDELTSISASLLSTVLMCTRQRAEHNGWDIDEITRKRTNFLDEYIELT